MQKYNKLEIGLICLLILILFALTLAVQPSKAKEILQPSKYTEMVDIDTMQPLTYTDLKTEMKNLQKAQRLNGKGEPYDFTVEEWMNVIIPIFDREMRDRKFNPFLVKLFMKIAPKEQIKQSFLSLLD